MGYNLILKDGRTIYINADDFITFDSLHIVKFYYKNKLIGVISLDNIVGFCKNIYMS